MLYIVGAFFLGSFLRPRFLVKADTLATKYLYFGILTKEYQLFKV